MVGHALPAFAHLRGGKSVMTFTGGMVAVAPAAAALAVALCAAVGLARRDVAWGARAGVFGFPLLQLAVDDVTHVAATGGCMAIIALRFLTARARPGGPSARRARA
jgi:glycerol-3-phosphate acyltransferase PlsY